MKQIQLTNTSLFALVDDADFDTINKFKWYADKRRNTQYARRTKDKTYMHHLIIGKPEKGKTTDHSDRNGLNNQRANISHVSLSENVFNSVNPRHLKFKNGISTGVKWREDRKKWIAQIWLNKKTVHIGCYTSKEAAIQGRKEYKERFNIK